MNQGIKAKVKGEKVNIGYENISFGIVGATPSFAEAMDGMLESPGDESLPYINMKMK